MDIDKKIPFKDSKDAEKDAELDWENPKNPEKAFDQRDKEQLLRQKKEAERRKDNLSTK